ncbi:hypothetical protein [Amycolatopsis jejuensis]|uniref:hypothetical protein n=1 Tax=Amycolatopsis jejuensis TaxID=330084 RepID=UPI0005249A0B|nr:hypothetical protein [Amycolatopsis jejuensis]
MSARTIYLVFGSPATPAKADEVRRWYEPHLIEMCTLPGLISAQLFQPSKVQLPRLTTTLPQTMALYEFDTDDLAGAFKTLWASSRTRRIAPPADGVFELDPAYQSAVYDLDSEYPAGHGNTSPGDGLPPLPPARKQIMLVFGSPTSPDRAGEVNRWWEPHLHQMTYSPGLIACSLYRPSSVQLPRLTTTLPETMAVCEFDSADFAADIETLYSSHLVGYESGEFVPGKAIPPPPEGSFLLDPVYQTGIYELVSQWPKAV